jgi:UDP-N-acetylmuramate--alanine ligase
MYRGRIKKIHFVGIGGSGMSGIAEVLINLGYKVTGSDVAESDTTRRLRSLGAVIHIAHDSVNVWGADCVVYSSAVRKDNPEIEEAIRNKVPIIPRAEMLAELMRMKYGIAVAGTHGKTTTTSMIAAILVHAGIDPTVVTGGKLNSLGTNAKLGSGDFLVAEADESDGSFLKLSPTIAVVTSIDREHIDHYGDMEEVKTAYLDFINKVPFYGCVVLCLDHPTIQGLLPSIGRRFISYGLTSQADVNATEIEQKGQKSTFEVWTGEENLGKFMINLPGEHNVYNALAAIAVARELEINSSDIKAGLEEFTGVERRFQVRGTVGDIMVVDDYGHHPVEIKAVLKAAKHGWKRRVICVFQPHRYSRTKDLFHEFLSAFNEAEKLLLTDIYPAGEDNPEGVSTRELFEGIKEHGHKDVAYVPELKEVSKWLGEVTGRGDMVITLGAGDVWRAGVEFIEILKKRRKNSGIRLAGKQ